MKVNDFWRKVKIDFAGGCWEWQHSTTKAGYGHMRVGNNHTYAHRRAYELTVGPIPTGLFVCHACDNRLCCNPAHLWLGTAADNAHDRDNKGRGRYPRGNTKQKPVRPKCKVTADDVAAIRRRARSGELTKSIAADFSITSRNVLHIVSRQTWAHVQDEVQS